MKVLQITFDEVYIENSGMIALDFLKKISFIWSKIASFEWIHYKVHIVHIFSNPTVNDLITDKRMRS